MIVPCPCHLFSVIDEILIFKSLGIIGSYFILALFLLALLKSII